LTTHARHGHAATPEQVRNGLVPCSFEVAGCSSSFVCGLWRCLELPWHLHAHAVTPEHVRLQVPAPLQLCRTVQTAFQCTNGVAAVHVVESTDQPVE
jgi:hypothetical protein